MVDTSDGTLMLGAYNWTFVKPLRKIYYNLTITAVSVIVAVLVGGIEGLALIGDRLGLSGWFWAGVGGLNDNSNGAGFGIICLFIMAWIGSAPLYRYAGLEEVKPAKS